MPAGIGGNLFTGDVWAWGGLRQGHRIMRGDFSVYAVSGGAGGEVASLRMA